MIEMRQLHQLIAIAEFRSLRAAAEALDVQQSTLSRTVRAIEDELGAILLERRHSGVELTEAGQAFLREAKSAIELLERAQRHARLAGRGKTGSLTIGIQTSLGTGFLKELLRRYATAHPQVLLSAVGKERRRWQPRMLISLTGLSPADWLARDRHCASFSKRPARRAARDHRSSLPLERSAIPTARPRATTRVSCRSAHRSIPAS